MFGLMRGGPRLPYCGTCKTLGAVYGQKTRLLVNHDVAFLAEVLLEAGGDAPVGAAYRSISCLKLPRQMEEMPVVLRYAAAVSVVLGYFRACDHAGDAKGWARRAGWGRAVRALSGPYRRAAGELRGWGFPLERMAEVLESQRARERDAQTIAQVSEPTRTATAMVFSHGVRLAGRGERAELAWRLGSEFGELIYLLDAYEDRARDARSGSFNAFLAFADEYPGE
ncbi:MAG: hypothetical protein KGN36_03060, partial [Acidobacteriota bacterium]|nr:hypothetical protein [Acidobacteriota bacterium]